MNTEQTKQPDTTKAEKHFAMVDDLANKMCKGLSGFEIGVCLDALSFATAMIMAESGDTGFIVRAMQDFNYKTTKAAEVLVLQRPKQ